MRRGEGLHSQRPEKREFCISLQQMCTVVAAKRLGLAPKAPDIMERKFDD